MSAPLAPETAASLPPAVPPSPRPRTGKFFQELAVLLGLTAATALVTWALHPGVPPYGRGDVTAGELTVAGVTALGVEPLWVDGRSAADYAAGHWPGAVHLAEATWETGLAELLGRWDGQQPIVVYCGDASCATSAALAARLERELGLPRVYHLLGGWRTLQTRPNAPLAK